MAEPGEALEVRVDEEHRDRYRPEPANDGVELEDGHEKDDRCQRGQHGHLDTAECAGRELA
jgi:hypothetical protein